MTREEWLQQLTSRLAALFDAGGHPLPPAIRLSVGFPSTRATSVKNRRVGECWHATATADQAPAIFVSPMVPDALRVADILVHELVHAAVGPGVGHKGAFKRLALRLGLVGKMTATEAGPELKERLNALISEIGEYPHAAINPAMTERKKQTTRMVKASCNRADCGMVIRTARKWLDRLPECRCGGEFLEDVSETEEGE